MCHDWLEQLPQEEKEKVNNELREYKKNLKLGIVEFTTEKVKQAVEISFPVIEEDYIEIPVEPITEEELTKYEEYKKKRNEKIYRKFGVEYEREM